MADVRASDYELLARVLESEAAQAGMADCCYVPPDEAWRAALRPQVSQEPVAPPATMVLQPALTPIELRARTRAAMRDGPARPSAQPDPY